METNKSKGGRPRDPFAYSYVVEGKDKDDKLVWICKFCGHQFSIKTSSTRIKAHLGKVEKQDVIICARVPFDVEEAARNSMPSSSSKRSNANTTCNNDVQQPLSQECCTSNPPPPPPQSIQSVQEQCSNRLDGSLQQSSVDVQLNPLLQDDTRQSPLQRCRASSSPSLQNLLLDGSMQQTNVYSTCLDTQMDLSGVGADVLGHISPKEMQNFSEDDIQQFISTLLSDVQPNNMSETTLNTPQSYERGPTHGVLGSQQPMQHQREIFNCLPYQHAPRMDSTHDAAIPHNFLQGGAPCPNSLTHSTRQEHMPIAEFDNHEGLVSQHHMQENLQEHERISLLDRDPYRSVVPQMHHVHIDPMLESSDTPTSTLDQAMRGKKRKFRDQIPFGKILPLGTIFQGQTFNKIVDEISISLEDNSVSRVGIYGMGGSGKTSIMKHIHNLLLEGYFMSCDHVIWVGISQDHTISKLQHHLASKFKIKLPHDEDEVAWAALLYEKMRKMHYVLILDDVWDKVNLEQVGIPEPTRDNGCKLILTTRSLDVCKRMQCKPIFLDLLSENEAWDLFVNILNFNPNESTLQDIMKEVARECACLPLAIVTIAGSMRGVDHVHEWRNALESLRNRTYGFTEMKDQVIEKLKFSYYRLSEQLQKCLLSCALFPEDSKIDKWELIVMLIMEGTIGSNESLQSAYDHGRTILNKLENACLLTHHSFDNFKIHDLIRDMCLDITGDRFLVNCNLEFPPDESEYTGVLEKASLMDSEIEEICLDMAPDCPKLSTLLLSWNQYLTRISDFFFMGFPELKFLNLSGTLIEVLPSSITNLTRLKALVLQYCSKLRCLPCLTPLKALRLLDLWKSGIEEVPEGLENLVNLAYLSLKDTAIKLDSSLVVTNLVKLEHLVLPEEVKIVMKDAKKFKNLDVFMAKFANWEDFSEYVSFVFNNGREPSDFEIKAEFTHAGASSASLSYEISSEDRQVFLSNEIIREDKGEERIIRASLELTYHNTGGEDWLVCKVIGQIPSLEFVQDLFITGFSELHQGQTEENCELGGLFDATFLLASANLENLNVTFFNFTKYLISASRTVAESLGSSPKELPCFQNLRVLKFSFCENLESIASSANPTEKEGTIYPICFPNLRQLDLEYLPNWRGILNCPSIEYILVYRCPKLNRLPVQLPVRCYDSRQLTPPISSLKEIEGESEWWESLEWDQPHAKTLLQPYFQQWRNDPASSYEENSSSSSSDLDLLMETMEKSKRSGVFIEELEEIWSLEG